MIWLILVGTSEEWRHARVNEWVNEMQRLSEPAKRNGTNTITRRRQGCFYVQAALSPETSRDFRVIHLLASDISWKYRCLYAFVQLKTFFLIKHTFSSTNELLHPIPPSPSVTFLIRLNLASWKGKKSLFDETVSAKTGFRPSHRNFKQPASSVGTDRFKHRVG